MKRTKSINKDVFRKIPHFARFTPIAFAVLSVLSLSGCGKESLEEQLTIYGSVEDCIRNNPSLEALCKSSYDAAITEAVETAPKYSSQADCQAEFGMEGCQPVAENSTVRTGTGMWMPLLTGYMFGRLMGGGNQYAHKPLFTPRTAANAPGKFYDSTGRQYGNAVSGAKVSVNKDQLKPVKSATTLKRGGFGQMASKQYAAAQSRSTSKSTSASPRSSRQSFGFGG